MKRLENSFKKYLIKIIGTRWHVQSHEDKFSEGIADLSFAANGVCGWIELKQISRDKITAETILKPDHFSVQQVNWLKKRYRKSIHVFIFVKVNDRYFLFTGDKGKYIREGQTLGWYGKICIAHCEGHIQPDHLIDILTHRVCPSPQILSTL